MINTCLDLVPKRLKTVINVFREKLLFYFHLFNLSAQSKHDFNFSYNNK